MSLWSLLFPKSTVVLVLPLPPTISTYHRGKKNNWYTNKMNENVSCFNSIHFHYTTDAETTQKIQAHAHTKQSSYDVVTAPSEAGVKKVERQKEGVTAKATCRARCRIPTQIETYTHLYQLSGYIMITRRYIQSSKQTNMWLRSKQYHRYSVSDSQQTAFSSV